MKPETKLSLLRTEIWIKNSKELGCAEKQRMLKELYEIKEQLKNEQSETQGE
jgi:hypothetical protein